MQTEKSDAKAPGRFIQFICGLRGHERVLHFENKRVMMRCTFCGHDTPGWDTGKSNGGVDADIRTTVLSPQSN
jgi:hypothetical protein